MSASGMRIERRADGSEWLVGHHGCNDCEERSPSGLICTAHFNGEHISEGEEGQDGAYRIDARWPIEPAAAPSATPLRPAEEIAREMIVRVDEEERFCWFAVIRCGDDQRALMCLNEAETTESAHADAVGWLSRLIEQSRAEGGAAERERVGADIGEAHAALHEWEQQAGPGHPLHESVSRAHEALHRTACAMPAEQPRDLAARIRALIDLHVTRWLDASGDEATVLRIVVERLREAHDCVRQGRSVVAIVGEFRNRYRSWAHIVDRAADELEAIIREHGKEGAK